MELIFSLVMLGIFALVLGVVVTWVYLRNIRRYLVIPLGLTAGNYHNGNEDQQKAEIAWEMWQTGKYFKIIILSQDQNYECSASSDNDSSAEFIYISLLEKAVPLHKIEVYYATYDPPGHVIHWDFVTLEDQVDPSIPLPALMLEELFGESENLSLLANKK